MLIMRCIAQERQDASRKSAAPPCRPLKASTRHIRDVTKSAVYAARLLRSTFTGVAGGSRLPAPALATSSSVRHPWCRDLGLLLQFRAQFAHPEWAFRGTTRRVSCRRPPGPRQRPGPARRVMRSPAALRRQPFMAPSRQPWLAAHSLEHAQAFGRKLAGAQGLRCA